MRLPLLLVILCVSINVEASQLKFGTPITVTSATKGVFHHLESSGRHSLAINSQGVVAIVWEDNSSGTPQIYIAFKSVTAKAFTRPRTVSTKGPAYEPTIAALDDQFVVGWEARDQLWLRQVSAKSTDSTIQQLTRHPAHQLTLIATQNRKLLGVWSEKGTQHYQLHYGELQLKKHQLSIKLHGLVDPSKDKTDQQYPAVQITSLGTVVAWEDRRQGATRIMKSFAPAGQAFGPPDVLNEFRVSRIQRFGRGTGAMRVVLAGKSDGLVTATWLDKRDFEGGYDVYAARSQDGGRHFEKNELVQDALGNNTPQWHPAVAISDRGLTIVAWDDTRDGTPDIWYSLYEENSWSDDDIWPGGYGEGSQSIPVMAFEKQYLHLAWLERKGSSSSIHYLRARVIE